jgi:N-formylglutamate amidohydrolase
MTEFFDQQTNASSPDDATEIAMHEPFNDFLNTSAFDVKGRDTQTKPIIFNSPHSGAIYPQRFLSLSRLDERAIRASEDMDVHELFTAAPEMGAVLQQANFPRAYLDVNREPYELDARMFFAPLPPYVNSGSMRVAGGLGTIARIVAENRDIYARKLDPEDALARIELIYRPYHDSLRHLLAQTHSRFGHALLIDCHSMPSHQSGRIAAENPDPRPDMIVGDRYGTSCRTDIVDYAVMLLRQAGFSVAKNRPYAGGFITEHYGRPQRDLNAFQIEINRQLYMDEETLQRHSGFEALQKQLGQFIQDLMAHPCLASDSMEFPKPLAAE